MQILLRWYEPALHAQRLYKAMIDARAALASNKSELMAENAVSYSKKRAKNSVTILDTNIVTGVEENDKSWTGQKLGETEQEKSFFKSGSQMVEDEAVNRFLDAQSNIEKKRPDIPMTLQDLKTQEYLAKKAYAQAYRDMFPKEGGKVTDDYIAQYISPQKPGMFSSSKKRELYRLYMNAQDAISSLENAQNK